jgi:hypothetical protein
MIDSKHSRKEKNMQRKYIPILTLVFVFTLACQIYLFGTPPTATPHPTVTPTNTAIPPFIEPLIKNAMCRAGPGTAYDDITSFYSGQVLEIVGRNPDINNTWWLVVIPNTRSTCWISLVTAQATGNFDDIPFIYPPY